MDWRPGDSEEAAGFENGAWSIARGRPDVCFQTALNYASSVQTAGQGPGKLDTQQKEKLRQRYARRVVPMLREAVAAGFQDAKRLHDDPAFAAFRSDPQFQATLLDLKFPQDPFARP